MIRALWLAEGDRNTSFFQAEAKENARTNKIKSFKLSDGTTVTDQEGLEKSANEFYNRLFLAQDDTSPEVITVLVDRKVDDTMNERLCAPITDFEVEHAPFMMHPNKVRTTSQLGSI